MCAYKLTGCRDGNGELEDVAPGGRALLLAAALTVAPMRAAVLSELDFAEFFAGRRGGRLQATVFFVHSVENTEAAF